MKFEKIGRIAGRTGLVLKKYSPEILLVAGVTGTVATTVIACKATLKLDGVLQTHEEKMVKVNEAKAIMEEDEAGVIYGKEGEVIYTPKDLKKDTTIVYTQTAMDFVKLYGPAVTLGVASIACILGSYKIMNGRQVALMAAYKTVEAAFGDYRSRVIEKYGEDVDFAMKYGFDKTKIDTIEEVDGKEVKKKENGFLADNDKLSQYARFFDETAGNYRNDRFYDEMFLTQQQAYFNNILHARGHVFLNEVYDALGIARSKDGNVVGWFDDGSGDGFIDFGLNMEENQKLRNFADGDGRKVFLLDFNVDGIIWDKLGDK